MTAPAKKKRLTPAAAAAALALLAAAAVVCRLGRHGGAEGMSRQPAERPGLSISVADGAQLLRYPLQSGLISAGYMNAGYEQRFGFAHYGLDIVPDKKGTAEVLSAGEGIVLGVEFCDNSVGGVVVMQYDDVFCPSTGETMPLVARYYHLASLSVKEGERLQSGQAVGTIDLAHQWYNHCHIELDADLGYPFHTPQVAEASSGLLVRYPASGQSLLDPVGVLTVPNGGGIAAHPDRSYLSEKDAPAWFERDFVIGAQAARRPAGTP